MAKLIKAFFRYLEEAWEAVPSYVKVFLFSTLSPIIGLYAAGEAIEVKTIALIVAANLGLYTMTKVPGRLAK